MTHKTQCLCPGHSRNKQHHETSEMPRWKCSLPLASKGEEFQLVSLYCCCQRPVITVLLPWAISVFSCIRTAIFPSPCKEIKRCGMQTLLANTLFIGVLPKNCASMTLTPSYWCVFSALSLKPLINTFFLTWNHLRSVLYPTLCTSHWYHGKWKLCPAKLVLSLEMKQLLLHGQVEFVGQVINYMD